MTPLASVADSQLVAHVGVGGGDVANDDIGMIDARTSSRGSSHFLDLIAAHTFDAEILDGLQKNR